MHVQNTGVALIFKNKLNRNKYIDPSLDSIKEAEIVPNFTHKMPKSL